MVDSVTTPKGKILHKIIYDFGKTEEELPSYQRASKLIFLPDEYENLTEKFRVKIKEMHEVMYKKGYEWISSICVTDCEIIPIGAKPEEKMKKLSEEYRKARQEESEDDYLF